MSDDLTHTVNFGRPNTTPTTSRKIPLRKSTKRKSNESQDKENKPEVVKQAMPFPDPDTNAGPIWYRFCDSLKIFEKCTLPHLPHMEDYRGFSSPTYSLELQERVFNYSKVNS